MGQYKVRHAPDQDGGAERHARGKACGYTASQELLEKAAKLVQHS